MLAKTFVAGAVACASATVVGYYVGIAAGFWPKKRREILRKEDGDPINITTINHYRLKLGGGFMYIGGLEKCVSIAESNNDKVETVITYNNGIKASKCGEPTVKIVYTTKDNSKKLVSLIWMDNDVITRSDDMPAVIVFMAGEGLIGPDIKYVDNYLFPIKLARVEWKLNGRNYARTVNGAPAPSFVDLTNNSFGMYECCDNSNDITVYHNRDVNEIIEYARY